MTDLSREEYLKKRYTRIILPAEEGGFTAEVLELPGCFAEGETPNETLEALDKAMISWIEAALEQGQEIPEPSENQSYGGKIALRLPRSLHRQASQLARLNQTSLNQFLVSSIAARIGAEDLYNRFIENSRGQIVTSLNLTMNRVVQVKIGSLVVEDTVSFSDLDNASINNPTLKRTENNIVTEASKNNIVTEASNG